ncbi:MAG: DUF2062 domain-containing protein [Burkholderiales bacterium]
MLATDTASSSAALQRWLKRQLLRVKVRVLAVLDAHPRLQPVARHVLAPHLWRIQHASVARGVAIGFFLAFVLPFGRGLTAALLSIMLRANIPVAALATFITNPINLGFWLWLAYELGHWLLGIPATGSEASASLNGASVVVWMQHVGWPAAVGMGVFAVSLSLLGYAGVHLLWLAQLTLKRRARARRAASKTRSA